MKKYPHNEADTELGRDAIRYAKPKILAVDLKPEVVHTIQAAGYNVEEGTFGSAYRVPRSNKFRTVELDSVNLPGLHEQEVIIVDLEGADWISPPEITTSPDVQYYWQSCENGRITPRALAMTLNRSVFEKIFSYSGVCIVLLNGRQNADYLLAKWNVYRGVYDQERKFEFSNWSFLNVLDEFDVKNESGQEIIFEKNDISDYLQRYAEGATYECTIEPVDYNSWLPLAKNKYGSTVAGALLQQDPTRILLLLPQMPKFSDAIIGLLERFISSWRPDLFPHLEGVRWVHRPEYELPGVTELSKQIHEVKKKCDIEIDELHTKMTTLRDNNKDWYTLLRGTGDELVNAVIRSFRLLGFESVVDVDDEERKKGNTNLREDIQIRDEGLTLIIDVKGIKDCPSDEESTQAAKHATMRMREWEHTKVKPLTIVNHQRNLPPLERNPVVYREEMIGNANDQSLGLMTTWDLFRILRNKELLGWPDESVKAIFYRSGLIDIVPDHYQFLGTVAKKWSDKFGVIIEFHELHVGEKIAVQFPVLFEEFDVPSIYVDERNVEHAKVGDRAGLLWDETKSKIREGMKVFRVIKN